MQIILLEKVGSLGVLGDVVNVKNGYARNYLIPQGKAKRANKENLAEFEARRAEFEARQAEILKAANDSKEKLDGQTITIAQKQVWTADCSARLPLLILLMRHKVWAWKLLAQPFACLTVL